MRTPAGKECPYFFGDYHRGRDVEECRLLDGHTREKTWSPDLCRNCPVPDIARANACEHLFLELHVRRTLFGLRRELELDSYCRKCECSVDNPYTGCGQCHPDLLSFIQVDEP